MLLVTVGPNLSNVYDEGLVLHGAQRVAQGDWPYRDFWTIYAPLQYWALAGLFKVLGAQVLTERLFAIAVRSLFAVTAFLLTRKIAGSLPAALVWLISLIWLGAVGSYGYPLVPAGCFALLAAYALVTHFETRSRASAVAAGALTAVVSLFRHDIGACVLAATLVGLALARHSIRANPLAATQHCWARLSRNWRGGFSADIVSPAVLLLWHVPFADLWDQLVSFPLTTYPDVRALPFPGPSQAVDALRGAAESAAIASGSRRYVLAGAAWIGLLAATMYPAGVLMQSDLARQANILDNPGSLLAAGGSLICPRHDPGRSRSICFELPPNQRKAIDYVRKTVPTDEPVFVAAGRDDKPFANDILFYFLSDRPSATKYHELHPGLATTRKAQQEITRDIEDVPVDYAVVYTGADGIVEPNASAESSGVFDLDDHLASRFREIARFGPYIVLRRSAPATGAAADGYTPRSRMRD